MKSSIRPALFVCATLVSLASAQNLQRQANITGGGNQDRGKCTVEIVVDGAAQVEIRGATATLRNLSGQPAQWRRFECTGVMPANLADFRFQGVDGRGRQSLVRDPRQGGVAVVQIEDKDAGAQAYTFDIMWDSGGNRQDYNTGNAAANQPLYRENGNQPAYRTEPNQPDYRNETNQPDYRTHDRNNGRYRGAQDEYRPNYHDSDYYRRYGHGFGIDEATRVCEQAVARQAAQRFGSVDVHFHQVRVDDNPGRNDWILGSLDVHPRAGRSEIYNFACSVNFENGRVLSAQLDSRPMPGSSWDR